LEKLKSLGFDVPKQTQNNNKNTQQKKVLSNAVMQTRQVCLQTNAT
jgi:hypothetical protein